MGKQNTKLTVEGFVSGCEWLDCVKGSFCQTDVYSISSLTNNKQIDTMKELLTIADAKFGVYKKKAFAEILGITNDRFLKICSGDEQPSTNELTKISECLGVAFYIKGSEIRVVLDAADVGSNYLFSNKLELKR